MGILMDVLSGSVGDELYYWVTKPLFLIIGVIIIIVFIVIFMQINKR